MIHINKLPNWNGMRFGKENCLVLLLDEFQKNEQIFQKWLAVYDIEKKLYKLGESRVPAPRFNFLRLVEGNFVIVEFVCDKVDLDEDNATIFDVKSLYFNTIEQVVEYIEYQLDGISPEDFKLSWKVNYPLGY